jgi:hypothetical protein
MTHVIACPDCEKELQVPQDLIGNKVQCPECQHTFIAAVPEESQTPANNLPVKISAEPTWDKKTKTGSEKRTRSRREDDDGDDDYDDIRRPSSRRGRGEQIPGKVSAIAIMTLIGGILATILGLTLLASIGASTCGFGCLWPGFYYSIVVGILAIVKGSSLLGANARSIPPPTGIAVMLIINIINADVIGMTLGILILVFSADEEVINYLARD